MKIKKKSILYSTNALGFLQRQLVNSNSVSCYLSLSRKAQSNDAFYCGNITRLMGSEILIKYICLSEHKYPVWLLDNLNLILINGNMHLLFFFLFSFFFVYNWLLKHSYKIWNLNTVLKRTKLIKSYKLRSLYWISCQYNMKCCVLL